MIPSPVLIGHDHRVMLAPLRLEHLYTHFEWHQSLGVLYFDESTRRLKPRRLAFDEFNRRFVQEALRSDAPTRRLEILRTDGTLIGVARLDPIDVVGRRCRIGLAIPDAAYRGLGYGRAALEALLDLAFDVWCFWEVVAEVPAHQHAWVGLLEACGFTPMADDETHWHRLAHQHEQDAAREMPHAMVA